MRVEVPELCLVALVGASGSGKSTFAKTHFRPTEILSSDFFRGLVSDDETDQSATTAAFDSLYYVAGKRLEAGRLTVIDATNVQKKARDVVLRLAREQNVLAAAIVFDMPQSLCIERNKARPDRNFGPRVVQNHARELQRSIKHLRKEGFRFVYTFTSPEEAAAAEIVRTKLWNDKKDEAGPFDIIGDVHGCYDELCALLEKLGYAVDRAACAALPPANRRAIFLGDLCDRGPKNPEVLRLVMNMTGAGSALCIPGNHDVKLLRCLRGAELKPSHGLDITLSQLEGESPEFVERVRVFLDGLVSHYVLDRGRLVVSHAGLKESWQGRSSDRVRAFCLYGDTTGETDEFGLPVRLNWAGEYRGKALVVYGHVPSREPRFLNNTVCIDTGCVFGGSLSAYRYPEAEVVSAAAAREYYAPAKPLDYDAVSPGNAASVDAASGGGDSSPEKIRTSPAAPSFPGVENLPAIEDLLGRLAIETRLYHNIIIGEESSAAALEIMSRFSADPRWLIYLPPTMSPCKTSALPEFLEHPAEAFAYYRKAGLDRVVCEEKHMGSRAVIVLCRTGQTAAERFGVTDGSSGIIYTRTGRHFFDPHSFGFSGASAFSGAQAGANTGTEDAILERLRNVLESTGFWERFNTAWVCLDTELMPWSAKARALLLEQYAPAGRAGRDGLAAGIAALKEALAVQGPAGDGPPDAPPASPEKPGGPPADMNIAAALERFEQRKECLDRYTGAYRRYCWNVSSIEDYRIAPFHILATEGKAWNGENHLYHLEMIRQYMTGADPLFIATNHITVDLNDERSAAAAADWWLHLTGSGGEGMVVKPLDFIARRGTELLQPAVKCRGREYLRIIYGPEYTVPEKLERLRRRSLAKKRRLALAEFALGQESLERFVRREPFHRPHECVFAVLALENEAVDPRL
ncbi:MAG: polynucleotide kinase-phosphatase [Spirochaetaceae bacterium]|jgi:protein phosphatase|nr:polynucleotide kinase-phosphatase [Spirochaetaceae bacterium]